MINPKEIEVIKKCLEKWYNSCSETLLKSESKELLGYSAKEGGVPKEMEAGVPDEEFYVKWKLIPSRIEASELHILEREYDILFPELFKNYLMSYCHLGVQFKINKRNISLPEIPSDYQLKQIKFDLDAWKPLTKAGYIPIGDYEDGRGPICFDIPNKDGNEDCPVVWFDHEELFDLDFEEGIGRAELERIKKNLFNSFSELLNSMI